MHPKQPFTVNPPFAIQPNRLILAADVANSANNVLANVTGLFFSVTAGQSYWFRFVGAYTSAATTTGSRWTINGPAVTNLAYTSTYTIDATSQTVNFATAVQIPAAANASSLATGNVAKIEGFIKPSADGVVQVQFASEVNSSAITALGGLCMLEFARIAR